MVGIQTDGLGMDPVVRKRFPRAGWFVSRRWSVPGPDPSDNEGLAMLSGLMRNEGREAAAE